MERRDDNEEEEKEKGKLFLPYETLANVFAIIDYGRFENDFRREFLPR